MSITVKIKKQLGSFCLDVDFTAENEVFALLGASGCGKSMTLKCIAGIERPDSGFISINDRVVFDSQKRINLPPQKRKVGFMFQDYALFPNMTVEKNIRIAMGKHPDPDRVRELIHAFALEGFEDRLPTRLSGGQKQRVALARMMATEPDILLMDEPLSALDTYLRWQMEEELLELFSRIDRTVLFVTHSRDEVYHLCDRVCIVQEGKSQPAQEKEAFFSAPGTLAAARISGCRNFSGVTRLSDRELLAEEWGMHLTLSLPVPADITHVGIRAHYIDAVPADEEAKDEACPANTAVFDVVRIYEQQFESELILSSGQTPDGERHLMRILMSKDQADHLKECRRVRVNIQESDLLLLRE